MGLPGATNRQALACYYDDVDRCRNCVHYSYKARVRKVPTTFGPYKQTRRIENMRCGIGDFPIAANGICNNYERRLE